MLCFSLLNTDCDVESREAPDEDCRLERVELPNERICTYTPRPETREVCQDVTMRAFAEECRQVPKLIPKVECDRDMKPIPLKEICVKVDLQLPREECKWETRKECKLVYDKWNLIFLNVILSGIIFVSKLLMEQSTNQHTFSIFASSI